MWKLLVVDDDARLAQMIARLAREMMPDLTEAHAAVSPRDALGLLDSLQPEDGERLIVLSDYNLRDPSLTGLDVLRHAETRHPDSARILMSGEDPATIGLEEGGPHVHRFMEKPFLYTDLLSALDGLRPSSSR